MPFRCSVSFFWTYNRTPFQFGCNDTITDSRAFAWKYVCLSSFDYLKWSHCNRSCCKKCLLLTVNSWQLQRLKIINHSIFSAVFTLSLSLLIWHPRLGSISSSIFGNVHMHCIHIASIERKLEFKRSRVSKLIKMVHLGKNEAHRFERKSKKKMSRKTGGKSVRRREKRKKYVIKWIDFESRSKYAQAFM